MTNTILLYDRTYKQPNKIYLPFTENNVLLKSLSDLQQLPILNFWTMDNTVILGMADQRLNNLSAGLNYLKQSNYKYFVRNSGGLAVVNDSGVLNVSLFLPRNDELSINSAYQRMVDLIKNTLPKLHIDVKEIPDSYCPGDYDLSVNGKKFAGISQRRVTDGIVIMAYISINGNQKQRSSLIQSFYEQSEADSSNFDYPNINPQSMANLDELLEQPLSIDDFKKNMLDSLANTYKFDYEAVKLYTQTTKYQEKITKALLDLEQRNENII
ncbi:lipoate--protein ligase A [Companilactobacillus sp. RD055328]|uniref:lipoate--protein ligase family protein n=1 Tax=Companilactobacillus sp. RD055328 TaxID=2916634 RepID=UPI001FC7D13C|nr:lipoate--protein ligase family protein [Companilactobacillus sp. RD055328]GKQ42308.1 lipoate--protein ligase A [Companilactobacillus sp. RD055328]